MLVLLGFTPLSRLELRLTYAYSPNVAAGAETSRKKTMMTFPLTAPISPPSSSRRVLAGRPAPVLSGPFARQLRTGRQFLEARRGQPAEELAPTAWPSLDRLLSGGLRRGALVELVGHTSSGRFSLVLGALAAATGRAEPAALIDLGDGLDPRLASAAGIELERLLWVRPRHLREALLATETILGAGLPMVVLDLGLPPIPGGRGVEAAWLRLARTAQSRQVALLVASPYRVSGTAAAAVVEASERRAVWRGRGEAPRVLAGLRSRLGLTKGEGWQNAEPQELLLHLETPLAEPLPLPAVAAPLAESPRILSMPNRPLAAIA